VNPLRRVDWAPGLGEDNAPARASVCRAGQRDCPPRKVRDATTYATHGDWTGAAASSAITYATRGDRTQRTGPAFWRIFARLWATSRMKLAARTEPPARGVGASQSADARPALDTN